MSQQIPENPAPGTGPGDTEDTEKNRMRAMYQMLFERNPDGICYADSQGNMTLNQTAMEMSGAPQAADSSDVDTWQQRYGIFLPDGKTPYPNEELPMVRALVRRETVRDALIVAKNVANPQGRLYSCNAAPMPGGQAIAVIRDVTDSKRLEDDLAQRNEELARQTRANNDLIERLRLAVDELSTPVLELWDDILALPVVGVVDTVRSSRMMEKILAEVVARRCRAVIIDVTGVDVIDTSTADRFIRIARSIELLGADCVICGVQPAVAQTLTDLGVSFRGLSMQRNLKRALDVCIMRLQQSRRATTA